MRAGETLTAAAAALGIGATTATNWARAGGFQVRQIRAAAKPPTSEDIADQKKRALDYYRAGDIDLAAKILKEAERRESLRGKFEKLTDVFEPRFEQMLAMVDRFVLRLHGIEPTPERLAIGASPAQRWAVWQMIPPYYQALRARGAVMEPFGRVSWPDGHVPDADHLPERPRWMPSDPWDETIDMAVWMAACGEAIEALGGRSHQD